MKWKILIRLLNFSKKSKKSRENKSTSTREDLTTVGVSETLHRNELPRVCILRKTSRNDELGFSIARIKDLKEHVINDVVPDSLADRAGLRPNDCLLEVNGENVENKSHLETVKKISELKQHDSDISLLVVQKGTFLFNLKKGVYYSPFIYEIGLHIYCNHTKVSYYQLKNLNKILVNSKRIQ